MIFRSYIREPIVGVSPGYNLCDQGLMLFDVFNLSANIYVDGELLAYTSEMSSGITPNVSLPYTTIANGYTVRSITHVPAINQFNDHIKIEIDTPILCVKIPIKIELSKANYNSFSNTFNVFGYDVGNNSDLGIITNPEMEIVMIPLTYLDGLTLIDLSEKCYSSFVAWREPYTNYLYVYKNNSKPSLNDYYEVRTPLDNKLIGTTNNFIYAYCNNTTIYAVANCRIDNGGCSCGCGETLVTCTSSAITYTTNNYYPRFSLYSREINGCNCVEEDCTIIGEQNNIETGIDFDLVSSRRNDDTITSPYDSLLLEVEVINAFGAIVQVFNTTIDTSMYPVVYNSNDYLFTYIVPANGDYKIKGRLTDNNCFECNTLILVKSCNYLLVTELECGKYRFRNLSVDNVFLGAYEFATDSSNAILYNNDTLVYNITIPPCGFVDLTFKDSIYTVHYNRQYSIIINSVILNVWCKLKDCIRDAAITFLCNENKCDCNKSLQSLYIINSLITQLYFYFGILNERFNYAAILTEITADDISKLFTLREIKVELDKLCVKCVNAGSIAKDCKCNKSHNH